MSPEAEQLESYREAVYLYLYSAWPEWRSRLATGEGRAALDSLCADGRVEQGFHGYRVRMGLA